LTCALATGRGPGVGAVVLVAAEAIGEADGAVVGGATSSGAALVALTAGATACSTGAAGNGVAATKGVVGAAAGDEGRRTAKKTSALALTAIATSAAKIGMSGLGLRAAPRSSDAPLAVADGVPARATDEPAHGCGFVAIGVVAGIAPERDKIPTIRSTE
jgi:hypothetical protein